MATSPTATAVKKNEPVTSQEFGKHVDYFRDAIKATFNLQTEVYRHAPSYKIDIKSHEIGRKEINNFLKAILYQMNDLKKMFNTRRRKIPRNNTQLNSLFYVSDQLVSFYEGADLGPSDPSVKKSKPLESALTLLTEKHMATSGILTSLFSRYVEHNGLKSDKEDRKGRFMPDSRMKSALATTNPLLHGEDLTERELPSDIPSDKMEKINDVLKNGSKSAFQRVDGRESKRKPGEFVYDKKRGLMFLAIMIFNNYYRIKPEFLTEDEIEALKDEENIAMSKELQDTLSGITAYHKANN